MNKKIRQIVILVSAFVLLGISFWVSQALSEQKQSNPRKTETPAKKYVKTYLVRLNKGTSSGIILTGRLIPAGRVEIFSEVTGLMLPGGKIFKEGSSFAKGEVIVRMDDTEARLSLLALKSSLQNTLTQMMPDMKIDFPGAYQKWLDYLKALNLEEALPAFPEPESDKEKYFVVTKGVYNQYYTIKSQEERLRKYLITAPFSGVVIQSAIYPGTLIRSGQSLGSMTSAGSYELDAALSLKDLDLVRVGNRVNLFSEDISGGWEGNVVRISDKIDETTQSARVFIAVSGNRLKEGMYLSARLNTGEQSREGGVAAIPRILINEDTWVYAVENNKLVKKTIEIDRYNGDLALVKGLSENTLLLNQNLSGAYEGMKVDLETEASKE